MIGQYDEVPEGALQPVESKSREFFKPGISFRNSVVPRSATIVRNIPWLAMKWQSPMTVVPRKGTPHNTLESKILNVRRGYWRRKAKDGILTRLNHSMQEIPNFTEMGLGQTPDNENQTPTHERGFWGNLTSLLTAAGTQWQRHEEVRVQQKAEVEKVRIQASQEGVPTGVVIGTMALAALAGGYFLLTAKPSLRI